MNHSSNVTTVQLTHCHVIIFIDGATWLACIKQLLEDSPVSLSSDLMDLEPLPAHSLHFDRLNAVLLLLPVRVDLSCGPKVGIWVARITAASKENRRKKAEFE